MEIYFLVIIYFLFLSFFESRLDEQNEFRDQNPFNKLYWAGIIFVIFIVGFRWEMATDWLPYYDIYLNSASEDYIPIETGYLLLNQFFLLVLKNYQYFLIFHAVVFYVVLYKYFKYFTHYVAFAFLWYFATTLGIIGSSRQLLALAIASTGLLFYLKTKNKVVFIVAVLLAISMHNSAIFMFAYFFMDRTLSRKQLLLAMLASLVIGYINISQFVVNNIGFLGQVAIGKIDIYSNEVAEYSLLAIAKRLVVILPILLFFRGKLQTRKHFDIVINAYVFGICVYLAFGQSLNIVATRGAMYFNLMEPIIMTYYLFCIPNRIIKHAAIIVFTIISIVLMRQSIVQYPELFVPYKNVFFETDLIK